MELCGRPESRWRLLSGEQEASLASVNAGSSLSRGDDSSGGDRWGFSHGALCSEINIFVRRRVPFLLLFSETSKGSDEGELSVAAAVRRRKTKKDPIPR
ncbi:unnamed protein product [Boreogadus saida]